MTTTHDLPLFTAPAPSTPQARRTDPETSHAAAASLSEARITENQACLLQALAQFGPMTDTDLVAAYQRHWKHAEWTQQSDSGLRTRRKELTDKGCIVYHGEATLATGRKAQVWRALVSAERAA